MLNISGKLGNAFDNERARMRWVKTELTRFSSNTLILNAEDAGFGSIATSINTLFAGYYVIANRIAGSQNA